ncbi:hypothetical protein QTG54_000671 [Skeletonema marinoi]|uniref:Uncharacterized protein n=1 Tax=Skeletonema marinoi TaxID=267567 RepID=A0AAD8YP09_9STRA|nr:hypothetical protein QTG54_000671 [Skeletonema marinoi]|eukprot:scaffold32658_cov78-Skeletonema_dohrnii-CCMP3373.AAC.3
MVRFTAVFISAAAALSNVEAFVPASNSQVNLNRAITCNLPETSTSLNAAPTMTAIDTIAYGVGATDEVKGTGVWSGFELKREPKEEEEEKKDDK